MLAFAVLLASVTGAAAPPAPMMSHPSMPVMRPVIVQPIARPVAPAPPATHVSSLRPQPMPMPDAKRPAMPEMKRPAPTPSPFPHYNPYNNNYYYYGVRGLTNSCNNANWLLLNGGSWCKNPSETFCCPRPLFVP